MSARLRIAIQKSGRLAERSLELIRAAGYRLNRSAGDLAYSVENAPIDLWCVRDSSWRRRTYGDAARWARGLGRRSRRLSGIRILGNA